MSCVDQEGDAACLEVVDVFLLDGGEREDLCVIEHRRQCACDRLGACVCGVLEYAVLDMKTVRELCLEVFCLLDGHLKQEQR